MAGSRFKFVKYKIDEVDENNCTCRYSLIDGDMLGDKLETIKYEVKFEAFGEGSVCKSSSHYHMKGCWNFYVRNYIINLIMS